MKKFKEFKVWFIEQIVPKILSVIWSAIIFSGSAVILLWVINLFLKQVSVMGW